MAQAGQAELAVDIVSDVVCPWCIVGYKQLEQAVRRAGLGARITWHPFELNPDMPAEGEDLRAHMMRKYGITAEQSDAARARLTALGRDLGFAFRFSDASRMVNTFRAHQLLHWAGAQGRGHALKLVLFAAYFSEGLDLNDPHVLAELAGLVGLDPAGASDVLADGRLAGPVRQAERFWTDRGIRGVPAMVFQTRHLVTGAQGADRYGAIIARLTGDDPA